VWGVIAWWWDHKQLGLLPHEGDMGEQPQYVVEVIRICEAEAIAIRNEQAERDRQEIERVQKEASKKR